MTFLRNCWYVAAQSGEISRIPLAREILREKLVFFRTEAGEARALGNLCPHRFASLSNGKLIGDVIECPYHGLRFDASGACVHNPHGDGSIAPHARVAAYPLAERFGYLWIWMGEANAADPDLIPDFAIMARNDWAYVDGYLQIDANYQLIVDNLLDLSHIQFLHPFLSSPEWVAKSNPSVSQDGTVVHVENHVPDIQAFPVWHFVRPSLEPRGEQWMDIRWDAPSHVYIDIRYRTPEIEMRAPNGHFMTPINESSTHYFFRVGRNDAVDDAEMQAALSARIAHAFSTEDEPMILDQQTNLGLLDLLDARPLILSSDAAAVRARRILSKKIRKENERSAIAA